MINLFVQPIKSINERLFTYLINYKSKMIFINQNILVGTAFLMKHLFQSTAVQSNLPQVSISVLPVNEHCEKLQKKVISFDYLPMKIAYSNSTKSILISSPPKNDSMKLFLS